MESSEQILKRELDILIDELIEAYDRKGMRASGKWAESLKSEVRNGVGSIFGEKYTDQLEYGRRPGGFPPIDQIEQWVQDKGIRAIENNISNRTLAFLIARKIAREGWKREGRGGVDLISEVVTPQRVQQILNKIVQSKVTEVNIQLTNDFIDTFNQ